MKLTLLLSRIPKTHCNPPNKNCPIRNLSQVYSFRAVYYQYLLSYLADDLQRIETNIAGANQDQSQLHTNGTTFNDDEFDQFNIDSSVFSALDNISDDWFGPFLADLIC